MTTTQEADMETRPPQDILLPVDALDDPEVEQQPEVR